jgi:hypothetical protein
MHASRVSGVLDTQTHSCSLPASSNSASVKRPGRQAPLRLGSPGPASLSNLLEEKIIARFVYYQPNGPTVSNSYNDLILHLPQTGDESENNFGERVRAAAYASLANRLEDFGLATKVCKCYEKGLHLVK